MICKPHRTTRWKANRSAMFSKACLGESGVSINLDPASFPVDRMIIRPLNHLEVVEFRHYCPTRVHRVLASGTSAFIGEVDDSTILTYTLEPGSGLSRLRHEDQLLYIANWETDLLLWALRSTSLSPERRYFQTSPREKKGGTTRCGLGLHAAFFHTTRMPFHRSLKDARSDNTGRQVRPWGTSERWSSAT
ncbi:Serine/threonine protein kinase [Tolypocladium capitatum]|uniref:Serine/threonine protein kinase n=1 Tax=Tolypocladium capitatum TaxID=45235 RepID=A0A2K3Q7J4_9HYPO|nr:Serine/threonine protein kinase [Tolypocladium capitatum]